MTKSEKGCTSFLSNNWNINPIYFSGALDVIVVQDAQNKLKSS